MGHATSVLPVTRPATRQPLLDADALAAGSNSLAPRDEGLRRLSATRPGPGTALPGIPTLHRQGQWQRRLSG